MDVLWSKVGEETPGGASEFVLAFPDGATGLLFAARLPNSDLRSYRHLTTSAGGHEPVLFTRSGQDPLHLWTSPAGGGPAQVQAEAEIDFVASMEPDCVQLFLTRVTATQVTYELGPRIDWPGASFTLDNSPAIEAAADALRATGQFEAYLSDVERDRSPREAIYISATPQAVRQNGRMEVAQAIDLWPRSAFTANIRIIRESNRSSMPEAKTAIVEQYARISQRFEDRIEIAVDCNRAQAKSLILVQIRRQAVARDKPRARAEPEIEEIIAPVLPEIAQVPLSWQESGRRLVASTPPIFASRGDWFILVSLDAKLRLSSLRDADGEEALRDPHETLGLAEAGNGAPLDPSVPERYPTPIEGFAPAEGASGAANMIAWRHDGWSLRAFHDLDDFKLSSTRYSDGLVSRAIARWINLDYDVSMHGRLKGVLIALRDGATDATRISRNGFIDQILGEGGRARRQSITRHSPFVALGALTRWVALERLAVNNNWKASLGQDERSIDRLLSPVTEWLARNPSPVSAQFTPADMNSDVADHFLRTVRTLGNIPLSYPVKSSRLQIEPDTLAAFTLLLLSDPRGFIIQDADIAGAALNLRDVTDPRVPGLTKLFASLFVGQPPTDPRLAACAFYRAAMLELDAKGPRGSALLDALYAYRRAGDSCFSIEDLNGGSLDSFDLLAEFNPIFDSLDKSGVAVMGESGEQDLRARVKNALASANDSSSLIELAARIARLSKDTDPQKHAALPGEIDALTRLGNSSTKDAARLAFIGFQLRETKQQLDQWANAVEQGRRIVDQMATSLAPGVTEKLIRKIADAIGRPPSPRPGHPIQSASYDVEAIIASLWPDPPLSGEPLEAAREQVRDLVCRCGRAKLSGRDHRDPTTAIRANYREMLKQFASLSDTILPSLTEHSQLSRWDEAVEKCNHARDLMRRATRSLKSDLRSTDDWGKKLTALSDAIATAEAALKTV
jgi:hypothetical protein